MKSYELSYFSSPNLSEEDTNALQQKIISLIKEKGGMVEETKTPIKKLLAYQIKKQISGFFAVLIFSASPEKIGEIKEMIKSEPKILRFIIATRKKHSAKTIRKTAIQVPKIAPEIKKSKESKVQLKEIEKKLEEILGS